MSEKILAVHFMDLVSQIRKRITEKVDDSVYDKWMNKEKVNHCVELN